MKLIHLSTPNAPVYSSLDEAKKEMNALTIKLSRYCENNDVNNIRFEIVVSNTSSHTGELTHIHIHALIFGEDYVATLAKKVGDYISSRHASVFNPEKHLRVYKKKHNDYEYLHEYLQKQARYQRAFERNFTYSCKKSESITTINDVANTGNSDSDDYKKAIFIEEMQIIINKMKSESEIYQILHPEDTNYTPALINPAEADDIIDDYEQGKKTIGVYTPQNESSEIYADFTQNIDANETVNGGMEYDNSNYNNTEDEKEENDLINEADNDFNEIGQLSTKEISLLRLILAKAPDILNMAAIYDNLKNQLYRDMLDSFRHSNDDDYYGDDKIPPF